MHRIELQVGDV